MNIKYCFGIICLGWFWFRFFVLNVIFRIRIVFFFRIRIVRGE